MEADKRYAIVLGLVGLILITLGIKLLPAWWAAVNPPADLSVRSVVLFFNVDEPCDCMVELAQSADLQMAGWQDRYSGNIQVMRIGMQERQDLEAKYKVFRAPCLVLVDANGEVAWRQDYPLIEAGPFKLDELEQAITGLRTK